MKSKKVFQEKSHNQISMKTWLVILLLAVIVPIAEGIRVYEGTNIQPPEKLKPQKTTGLSKKSLYISKRSWSSSDESSLKASLKTEKWKKKSSQNDFPNLYKIQFNDKNFPQYVKYIKEIPRLEEYTVCLWYKPNDLSRNHILFTYSLNKKESLLKFWVDPTDSTLRMAIREHLVYTVPAHIRKNKWHHICHSWHGVLGEWQIFLDGKRIGAGVLTLYKETYIPEGGEVVLGQEIKESEKEVKNEAISGEVFGFNLVDEAVPGEQANFINSQYKPNLRTVVPPFKKLPPSKKTYQQIKAYITRLPSNPPEFGKGIESKPYHGEEFNSIKRTRDPNISSKRHKGTQRIRFPPTRKVIIYNRDDRKLSLEDTSSEKNKTKSQIDSEKNKTSHETEESVEVGRNENNSSEEETGTTRTNHHRQIYNENYSIHSYKLGKDDKKSSNYEIYESLEDDIVKPETSEDGETGPLALERKARKNFDLYIAREANKVYTLSNAVRDARKPRFHFEINSFEGKNQKSVSSERGKYSVEPQKRDDVTSKRKPSDPIPVYETEFVLLRQKRNSEDPLTDSFRRLPEIPDGFINLFTQNGTKAELEQKLDKYFPKNSSEEKVNNSEESHPTANPSSLPVQTKSQKVYQIPVALVPAQTFGSPASPVNFLPPVSQNRQTPSVPSIPFVSPQIKFEEIDPKKQFAERIFSGDHFRLPETTTERRKFDVTSGTELIMRAYGLCTNDRGSPIRDKQHLVISWAETPLRIFGGAEIINARNECGNF